MRIAQVMESPTLWPGLLVCIMETLVPEEASKNKDEVEDKDPDEVTSQHFCFNCEASIDGVCVC